MTALRCLGLTGVLVALWASAALAQTVPDFGGTWSGSINGGAATGTFVLRQQGRKVDGTYQRSDAPEQVAVAGTIRADGVLEAAMTTPTGNHVTFEGRLGEGALGTLVATIFVPGEGPREATFRRAPVANPLGGPPPNPLGGPRANPLATPPPPAWAATWSDGAVKLVLEAAGGGAFRGTITVQGTAYPVTGSEKPPSLQGSFDVQGHPFGFTAALDGDVLTLTSEGATYRLRKAGATNPLAGGSGTAPSGAAQRPAVTGVYDGPAEAFRHSTGFTLDLPRGWTVQREEDGLLVLNVGVGQGDTLEAMVLISHGERDEADRGKTETELMAALGPDLYQLFSLNDGRLTGEPRAVAINGVPGAEASWSGELPNGTRSLVWAGGAMSATRFVLVVALIQQGREEQYLPRAKRILASTRLGE